MMDPHQPHQGSQPPHATLPEEVLVGNVADVETVGIAYAPAQHVAKSLEEGARVSYLASVAKEPAYGALPPQTFLIMPQLPP